MAANADAAPHTQIGPSENEMVSKVHEKIGIKIIKCSSLHSFKSVNLTTIVRVEFGTTVLGESQKYEYDQSQGVTQYDFECSLNVMVADPLALDELVQTPLVVTIHEVLPKDKKTKEEKTNGLGQTCIDLLSLVKGQKSMTSTYKLQPLVNTADSPIKNEASAPEIEISLSLDNQLLPKDQLNTSNLMRISVESLYSLPDSWNPNTGSQYMYMLALPMPISSQKDVSVIVPNGLYRSPGEKEQYNQKRWCVAPAASGQSLFMENSTIKRTSYQEEDGDIKTAQDEQFRHEAENDKSRVTWNSERRCFLSKSAADSFMKSISKNRVWPVEITRVMVSQGMKGKGKGEEEISTSFHGIAYIDLAPLLYPGVQKIRGAYLLKPFSDSELTEKTGRKGSLMDDAVKLISTTRSSSSIAHSKLPSNKGNKFDGKPKPSAAVLKPPESVPENEVHDAKRSEGQQYVDAKSYVVIELQLDTPLVPKRELDVLEKRISELIPPRPKFLKKEGGEKKAIECFKNQIEASANQLLDEYRKMFTSNIEDIDMDEIDRRKQEFMYHVNASGKYFALKEQLKYFVVKIVREKFKNTSPMTDRNVLQSFLSELYEFLLDQTHLGLGNYFITEETTEIPPPIRSTDMLKFFAMEAEVMFEYELAAKYYQEAEECFKEAVATEQKYLHGLLMNGCMNVMQNRHEEAEVFFEAATCSNPESIIAWTFLGLYYSGVESDIMAERAFNEAEKRSAMELSSSNSNVLGNKATAMGISLSEELENTAHQDSSCHHVEKPLDLHAAATTGHNESAEHSHESIFLKNARYCLEHKLMQFAERALSHELLAPGHGESAAYFQIRAELELLRKEYDKAEEFIGNCLKQEHDNADAWCLLGHLFFLTCKECDAKDAYERALSYQTDAKDSHTLYLRLSSIYLKEKEFSKAKNLYLKACDRSPSCISWLGVGISSYKLDELHEAEMALNEANIFDNHNCNVWAYLTLVCVKQKRHLEAEQCYKYAIKTGLKDTEIIQEMKSAMEANGFDMFLI